MDRNVAMVYSHQKLHPTRSTGPVVAVTQFAALDTNRNVPSQVFALLSFLPKPEGAESAPASRKKQMGSQLPDQETRDGCLQEVMQVFPDISPDYLQELSDKTYYSASEIILRIVERQESGMDYPRRQKKGVKRKLSEMESMEHEMESVKRKYTVTDAERAARLQSARDRNTM